MAQNDIRKSLLKLGLMLVVLTLTGLNPISVGAAPMGEKGGGEDKKPLEDYIVAQTAGYIGYVAIGRGKVLGHHTLSALIGHVPEHIGGVELWQLAFKYEWHPFSNPCCAKLQGEQIGWRQFYVGMSAIYGQHADLFIVQSKQYPDGYYPPTALRFTLNFGVSLKSGNQALFLEYSALDYGLIAYAKSPGFFRENYDYFGLEGIGSLGIGIKHFF